MIELHEAIRGRRSIRQYLPGRLSDEAIGSVLEAAILAPSAHNSQPWRFLVLRSPQAKYRLAQVMAKQYERDLARDHVPLEVRKVISKTSRERFRSAPVLIVAYLTMKDMHHYSDEQRKEAEHELAIQSMAAAIQNVLLMAHSKGLGACWFCAPLFCKGDVRRATGVPEDMEPQALITLGYPDESPPAPPRLPLKDIVRYEDWVSNP